MYLSASVVAVRCLGRYNKCSTFTFYLLQYVRNVISLQSSAVEQVLDILMDILSLEIAEVVFPCLPRGL